MIEIQITDEIKTIADNKAKEMGRLNNSITKGEGNLSGFIGEAVAQAVLGGELNNTYQYDLVLPSGKTVDVKTKRTTVKPKDYYDCSVAAFNTKQRCDYYCFVRVKDDLSVAWYLGVYDKQEYFKDSIFLTKGQIDPSNNFTVKADCYNLKINKLKEQL